MPQLQQAETEKPEKLETTGEFARHAVDFLSGRLASDVVLLDVRGVCSFADFFIIASGETDRHLDALANDLTREIRSRGLHAGHREGEGRGGWVLVDFPGFIVHLFSREKRDYYALEKLWGRATEVVRLQ